MRRKLTTLIALTTTACTSWQPRHGPVPSTIESESQTHRDLPVRLVMKTGGHADIYEPAVVGDSIVGMNGPSTQASRARVAIATADVERVETNRLSVGRTILAVAAIGLAVLAIAGAASSTSTTSTSNSSCSAAAAFGPPAIVA